MDFEMVAALLNAFGSFYFNLDANVGKGQPNLLDDVELVRFGYMAIREMKSPNPVTLGLRSKMGSALAKVDVRGPFGPDLEAAIAAHQAVRGGAQDGRVSVIPRSATVTMQYDQSNTFLLVPLVNTIRHHIIDYFPRLDKVEQCGPNLRETCKKIFAF